MSEQITATTDPLSALSGQLARLAENTGAGAVGIRSRGRLVASGFIWKPGVVITASDALEGADALAVLVADGRVLAAELAGRDATTDVAVLRVTDGLPAPVFTSAETGTQVGQLVVALGRGREGVIAALGMVSVAGGSWQSLRGGTIDALIRLDLRLHPRAEGGAVIDGEGRLLGMAVLGPRRRPLVIPAATIERVAPKLLADGRIRRGYLGVGLHPIRLDEALATAHALPDRRAVMVIGVDPDGPAKKAGVLVGDAIVTFDGAAVPSVRALFSRLAPESVGRSAELKVLRAGQVTTLHVAIGASQTS